MDPSSSPLPTHDHHDDEDSYYHDDDDMFDDHDEFEHSKNDVVDEHHDHHQHRSDVSSYNYTYPNDFNQYYCAYPFSTIEKSHLEPGNKVILPLSALDRLMSIGVDFPMLFSIENPSTGQTSHCGVLEFSAEEGMAFIPTWLMKNLSLENGELIKLKNVTLDRANYIKLQPHSVDFLDIKNPKEALETSFCGGYSCLSIGDTIMIMNEGKKFFIDVIDAKPSTAVCVIETDCEVDFSPPLDYKEPPKKVRVEEEEDEDLSKKFVPFCGRAMRLNGEGNYNHGEESKKTNRVISSSNISKKESKSSCECDEEVRKEQSSFKAFTGKKYTMQDL